MDLANVKPFAPPLLALVEFFYFFLALIDSMFAHDVHGCADLLDTESTGVGGWVEWLLCLLALAGFILILNNILMQLPPPLRER